MAIIVTGLTGSYFIFETNMGETNEISPSSTGANLWFSLSTRIGLLSFMFHMCVLCMHFVAIFISFVQL